MYDFSVIVCTYNSDIDKLFKTLKSIIWQENCSFEIIITDDGSNVFNVAEIEQWFKVNKFKDYTIIANKQNRGTLKNHLEGVKKASGKYIKGSSPGDFLYDRYTLCKYKNFIENNNYLVVFGRAAYYSFEDGNINIYEKSNPNDLEPYINKNKQVIFKNYLYYRDYILGSALIVERNILLKYLLLIQNEIIYAEDCSYILMVADGIDIGFLDEFIIWYEYGTGISTSGSKYYSEKIWQDNLKCFEILVRRHPELSDTYDYLLRKKYIRTFYLRYENRIHDQYIKIRNKLFKNKTLKTLDISKLKNILEN